MVPIPAEDVEPTLVSDKEQQLKNGTSGLTVMSVSASAEVSDIQATPTPVTSKSSMLMESPVSSDASTFTEASFLPLTTSTKTSTSPV